MPSQRQPERDSRWGFTLIELLVVVAIIALLISILLPSLSKAREQARTTLCLSRIGQFGKAFMMYQDDYDEGLPFIATVHEDHVNPKENWLADWYSMASGNTPAALYDSAKQFSEKVAMTSEDAWYSTAPEAPPVPRSGTIFSYTRFENLYRCPEFERATDPSKGQNVWNYTRPWFARYWTSNLELVQQGEATTTDWGSTENGVILKISRVHSPGNLPMIIDEQWNRHVATNRIYGGAYNGNDCVFSPDNVVAVSHGQPVTAVFHDFDIDRQPGAPPPFLWKRGGVFFYDSHAELFRDPWPTFAIGSGYQRNDNNGERRGEGKGAAGYRELNALSAYIGWILYAQRGYTNSSSGGAPPRWY
ncbi:MAG: prepilin-type N-terminal cleavage/methylation domain-containing protein [Phycisphaerae bacterium]|nr:prepilin-type N-terminal cleavage/methylation domain-containing protein [Phycisphaerae bacterium]